jgi:nucleoside 2-deoxyribosyltransferase
MQSKLERIYLAGPEVFLPDAEAIGEAKKSICRDYGCEGVFPIDVKIDLSGCSREEAGFRISAFNEELIRGCGNLIANLTPFRGISADVGTVYEMGLATGLNKRVFAYTNITADFTSRTLTYLGLQPKRDTRGRLRDNSGMAIEEWGLRDNLMLEGALRLNGGELIARAAPAGELYTNLEAFRQCVARIATAIAEARFAPSPVGR